MAMPEENIKLPLEVAVFSGANALAAQKQGAHRIELNAPGSYPHGGLTPPVEELLSISNELRIPARVMIRPVGASLEFPTGKRDFFYTDEEFEAMRQSIKAFKDLKVMNPLRGDGFVFGILKTAPPEHVEKDSRARVAVDTERCKQLVREAAPFPCIFHRAFDPICDTELMHQGFRDIVACGFEAVLTSGGKGSHETHLMRLDAMACYIKTHPDLKGLQLVIGGGLRSYNAKKAVAKLGTHRHGEIWMHAACLTEHPNYPGETVNDIELRDLLANLELGRPE